MGRNPKGVSGKTVTLYAFLIIAERRGKDFCWLYISSTTRE